MFGRFRTGLVSAAILLATLATADAAPALTSMAHAQSTSVMRIGMPGEPQTLNPFMTDLSYTAESFVYTACKLGQFAPDSTIVPFLATWDLSADGTTYTFHLNANAKWHDGQPVTAKDVVFTYELVANPDSGAIYFDRIKAIKGAQAFHDHQADHVAGLTAVDDHTVQVQLESANATWLPLSQSAMFIVPEHLLGSYSAKDAMTAPYWQHPVGCGPYTWDTYVPNQYIRLHAFSDYFMGTAQINELDLVFGPPETMTGRLQTGEVDLVSLQPQEVDGITQQGNANIFHSDSYVDNVDVNTKRPFLGDVNFRKGLLTAIDRESINNSVFFGTGAVAPNVFVTPWTLSPNITTYPYDPAAARQLIAKAGYDGSYDYGIMETPGTNAEKEALIIQQNLADVGVKSHLVPVQADFIDRMSAGDYDMGLVGYGTMSLLPDAAVGYIGADSLPPNGSNWSFLQDRTLTDLFSKAAAEADPAARTQIFYQITERTTDELPKLPLIVTPYDVAVSKRINIPNPVIVPRNRPGEFTWLTSNINTWTIAQ
jgi:peptide/nickel transport system substrate-binding protein